MFFNYRFCSIRHKLNRSRAIAAIPAVLLLSMGASALSLSTSAAAAELLDINQAGVEAIADTLAGIGPAKAEAIVEYRQQNGTFVQLEDLTKVPGIGEATLEQIKALITLGDASADARAISIAPDTGSSTSVIQQ